MDENRSKHENDVKKTNFHLLEILQFGLCLSDEQLPEITFLEQILNLLENLFCNNNFCYEIF